MNAEGVAYALSPEWIAAVATGIPILVLGWWILRGQGILWRRWVWQEAGADVVDAARDLGGEVQPLWTGWRVVARGVRVDWRGGLRGAWTRIRVKCDEGRMLRVRREGLIGAPEVRAEVERLRGMAV